MNFLGFVSINSLQVVENTVNKTMHVAISRELGF